MAHPLLISSNEMVNGGEIRTAFFSHNSQNKSRPFSILFNTTALAISSVSKMGASIKPVPLIDFIFGCFNKDRNSFSFS